MVLTGEELSRTERHDEHEYINIQHIFVNVKVKRETTDRRKRNTTM